MLLSGNRIPVLCNQENFLLRENNFKVRQALPNCHIVFKGARKNQLNTGRPANGMFIAIPDKFNGCVRDVSPENWRLQAVLLRCDNGGNILVINSYFPTDPGTIRCNENELEEVFASIDEVVNNNEFSALLLCGDINADFVRNTGHVRYVTNFLSQRQNLQSSWEKFGIDFTHFHEANGISSVSTIDHFFWSENLEPSVMDAGVIHSIDNDSDHAPIYCIIDSLKLTPNSVNSSQATPKPSWKRSSDDEKQSFKITINSELSKLIPPPAVSECKNVQCNESEHRDAIDEFAGEVLDVINKAAHDCLQTPAVPSAKKSNQKRIPGWNDEVKPYKEMSRFWASVWKSAGRPINNGLHQIMKKSRNLYHYQFKKCVKAEDKFKKSKLLNCLNGEGDIFQEIKKFRNVKPTVASVIDGKSDNIEEHFSQIYKTLYNSVTDKEEVLDILKEVHESIDSKDLEDVEQITPEKVKEATEHLNCNKTDPIYDFSSDCLKNGPDSLYVNLSLMLQAFLIHSHVSVHLLLAILVPIVKDRLGDISSSKNYRSIAISSLVLKIFDWLVILLFGTTLGLDDLQFSYQAGVSASMCTWLAMETIDLFLRNGGEVFSCQADKTKAFDLVKHSVLFRKLLEKKLSKIFLRLLIVMYMMQNARVRWNDALSELFDLINGCKQGAVLSGILYNFYVNNLFQKLRESKSGCWVDLHYVGMLGYADDDWLLAPSLEALQDMLNICEEYNAEHGLQFSTDPNPRKSKTKCIAFLKSERELRPMTLCGNNLPWVKSGKHVGQNVTNEADGLKHDMVIKRAKFIDRNNTLRQEFHFAHPRTLLEINRSYNSDYTGSPAWDLFCHEAGMVENSYSMAVRIMFGLPRETHRYFIEPLTNTRHIKFDLIERFLNFLAKIRKSKKDTLKYVLGRVMYDVGSVTGRNLNRIMNLCNLDSIDSIQPSHCENLKFRNIPEGEAWRIGFVAELIDNKHEDSVVENFSHEELDEILEYICTTGPS